ncbi:uracil-DNA glycosylase family protein [Segetibacter aerophilus]|uniref:DUF4918 domain-containing protein n=1 Tax=Segetibacter aerophilus TaxID=670293 RepID=A0A512BCS0_9BACT|nr:uracil-DNA glycosylase family protein [Segetibacter aerophilus]GEO09759.1 DUF4918 domain-containing protein [Segetibacter aerophilus]
MLSNKITDFLFGLQFPLELRLGVEVMNPFSDAETARVVNVFYNKYYNDDNPRYCIVGINPGRFGGGVTGVPFTDPIRLEKECGIENSWPRKQELSSVFVYDMINAFGGPEAFYRKLYFTSISPLGFTKGGKNLNYYDDKILAQRVIPFSVESFRKQIAWGLNTSVAFCLGEGENFKFLSKLNLEYKLFEKIVPLSHPRFIMQYKLKTKDVYIEKYLREFGQL